MNRCSVLVAGLLMVTFSLGASAKSSVSILSSATCEGTIIITMGGEYVSAVQATLFTTIKTDKRMSFGIKNQFATPLKGHGVASGDSDAVWILKGKDDSGRAFEGTLRKVPVSYPGDTMHHVMLELSMPKVTIKGPMSCTRVAP